MKACEGFLASIKERTDDAGESWVTLRGTARMTSRARADENAQRITQVLNVVRGMIPQASGASDKKQSVRLVCEARGRETVLEV